MHLVPKKFFISSGCAVSKVSDLNAFDKALLEAGIGELNIVSVSSVLPVGAEQVGIRELPMFSARRDFLQGDFAHYPHTVFNSLMERRSAKRADGLVVLNQKMSDYIHQAWGRPAQVIPCGVDEERFTDLGDERYVVYVGRLDRNKNLEHLVEAYAALPASVRREHGLKLVGSGGNESALRALVLRRGLDDRVEFVPWAGRERVASIIGSCSVLVLPSLVETFGIVLIEAMTSALEALPGLMILITPAIGMRGNVFGALGSRLGTAMHIGTFEVSYKRGSLLRSNLESSLLLTLVMSVLMGILATIIATALGVKGIRMEMLVFISVLGGMLAGIVLIFINITVAYLGFKRNWDIDNISAPVITAAGDIVTLPMLFLAAIIVMNSPGVVIEAFAVVFVVVTAILTYRALLKAEGETRRIFVQSSPVLIICIILDIAAGITIDDQLESLVALPALLVLIPPFLEDANALGGILTSRFASLLHMRTFSSKAGRSWRSNA